MTSFEDKLFALIHGLPIAEEPMAHLESGPSEPGAFQKMHERIILEHALGKRSEPATDEIPATLKELITKARDYRDVPKFTTVTSRLDSFELNKRAHDDDDRDGDEEVVTEYTHGSVIAKLHNGVVVSTRYIAKEA